eukprot:171806_1
MLGLSIIIWYLCSYCDCAPGNVNMKGNCFWTDYGGQLDACSLQPIQVNLEKFTSILQIIKQIFTPVKNYYNNEANNVENVEENEEFLNDVTKYPEFDEEAPVVIEDIFEDIIGIAAVAMFDEIPITHLSQQNEQPITMKSHSHLLEFENAVNNQFNKLKECMGEEIEIETVNIETEQFDGLRNLMNSIGDTTSVMEQMRLWDSLISNCIESTVIASDLTRNYTTEENIAFYLNKLPLISNYIGLCYGVAIEYVKTNKTFCKQSPDICNSFLFLTLTELTRRTISILDIFEKFTNIAIYNVYRWFKGPRRYYDDYSSGSCNWYDEAHADYLQCDDLCKVTMIYSKGIYTQWTQLCAIKMVNKWTPVWDCFGSKTWTSTDFVEYTGCQFWKPCQTQIDESLADNEPNANDMIKYDKKLILIKQDSECSGNISQNLIGNSFQSPQECYNKCVEKSMMNATISCKYIIYEYDNVWNPNCYGSDSCVTFISSEADVFLSINVNSLQDSIIINNYTPNCNQAMMNSSNPIIINQQCLNLYTVSLFNVSSIADEFDSVVVNNNSQTCSLYSYSKCNVRNIVNIASVNWIESIGATTIVPAAIVLYANNSKCNTDSAVYLGIFDTVSECAGECFRNYGNDCKYFDYGYGINDKKCYYESSCDKPILTTNNNISISYNIYLLIEYLYTNKTYSGHKTYIGLKSTVSECALACLMQQKLDKKPCKYLIFGRASSIHKYQKCYREESWSVLQNNDDYNLYQIPSTLIADNVQALLIKINLFIVIFIHIIIIT